MVFIHECFGDDHAVFFGRLDGPVHFHYRQCQRFFAQNVFAVSGAFNGPLRMQVVRQTDIHRVNAGIAQHRFVGAECAGNVPFFCIRFGGGLVPAGDRNEFRTL